MTSTCGPQTGDFHKTGLKTGRWCSTVVKTRKANFKKLIKNKSLYNICRFDPINHKIQLHLIGVSFGGWHPPLDCRAEVGRSLV